MSVELDPMATMRLVAQTAQQTFIAWQSAADSIFGIAKISIDFRIGCKRGYMATTFRIILVKAERLLNLTANKPAKTKTRLNDMIAAILPPFLDLERTLSTLYTYEHDHLIQAALNNVRVNGPVYFVPPWDEMDFESFIAETQEKIHVFGRLLTEALQLASCL